MPNVGPKIMGKVKSPSFFQGSSSTTTTPSKSNRLPMYVALVLVGVGVIWYLKSQSSSSSSTGSALTLIPSTEADQSSITNMIQAVRSLTGGVAQNLPVGGSGSDITGTNAAPISQTGTTNPFINSAGVLDYGSAANIPGFKDVSPSLQADWTTKLGGNYQNVGNPDPAESLAQWLEVAKTGTFLPNNFGVGGQTRLPVSQTDLAEGMAWAQAYAKQANVTPEQLAAAQQKIVDRYGASLTGGQNTTVFGASVAAADKLREANSV